METTSPSAVDQFVYDYLLVADNDRVQYETLRKFSVLSNSTFADLMRDQYEKTIYKVTELMRENKKFSEFERLLIMQLLAPLATTPFDVIAREIKERD